MCKYRKCRRFLKKSIVEASVDEVIASFNTYSSLLIDSMYNVSEEDKCYQRMTIADGGYKKLKLEYNDNYELTNPELDD